MQSLKETNIKLIIIKKCANIKLSKGKSFSLVIISNRRVTKKHIPISNKKIFDVFQL